MKQWFELTGSGISDGQDEETLLAYAKKARMEGAKLAFHGGMANQPMTIRFRADGWHNADEQAEIVRTLFYPENAEGRLCPMIRAYPVALLENAGDGAD